MTQTDGWKPLLLGAAVAILPDVDYLLVWGFGLDDTWHRSFTHSLIFALIVGLCAAAIIGAQYWQEALVYITAALSHGLLDALTTKESRGVELYWPFSTRWVRLGLFDYPETKLGALQLPWSDTLWLILKTSALEFVIFAPLLLIVIYLNKRRSPEQQPSRP
jgi:membrane-bound metal-dependent hydrolase YbcI (DUF457 family)